MATLMPPSLGAFKRLSTESFGVERPFPTPTSINHLACAVTDYAKSRDFYMSLLGMRLVWDDGKQCALAFGNRAAPNGLYFRRLKNPTDKPEVSHIAFGIPNFMKYKAAIKTQMEQYHLTGIRTDGEVGWSCNDPAGYMLNILIDRDWSVFPGAANPCEITASDKCRQAYAEGTKALDSVPQPRKAKFNALYFSHVALSVPEAQLALEVDFYREMMGMKVIYQGTAEDRKTFLRFGQNTLFLQKAAESITKPYCKNFGFVVEDFNSVKVEAQLKRLGLDPKADSTLAWSFTDPDGFRVEVAAPGFAERVAKDCKNVNRTCSGELRG